MPELRKDPIVGRWVIISTDRAKRPTDFFREQFRIKGGFCPFCYGNEHKTPPEVQAYRPNNNGGTPKRDTPGWNVRVVPNKFPALGIEGDLSRQAVDLRGGRLNAGIYLSLLRIEAGRHCLKG